MEGFGWIASIILGAIAGWIAEKIMKTDSGLLMNIILGIVGALIGNFLFDMLIGTSAEGSIVGQLIVAVIGACILIWIVRMVRGRA
ncbi:GlsB/YeaQ/YmgE family stress response membrane protein [Paracoccus sp. YIM 132242]|uniref:GlsB/YeaQ/YmgE family stress response membrane protein n=1 Tax=Paracoccus lichenicola TaxID=2665644 RepID=A0A6L6HP47_9RHOB|nr:GlsB/YeaQ/YmgE family stress response membrane protein [Paracoccus lichenicola]MTE00081.1 GlsB/YeaQ/YmgE family stress response membrane protein [Paracoccus lichenicola]